MPFTLLRGETNGKVITQVPRPTSKEVIGSVLPKKTIKGVTWDQMDSDPSNISMVIEFTDQSRLVIEGNSPIVTYISWQPPRLGDREDPRVRGRR